MGTRRVRFRAGQGRAGKGRAGQGKKTHPHVAALCQKLALPLHVFVGPSKHLDDRSLLPIPIIPVGEELLVNLSGVPGKVERLQINFSIVASLDAQGHGPPRRRGREGHFVRLLLRAPEYVAQRGVGLVRCCHCHLGTHHVWAVQYCGEAYEGGVVLEALLPARRRSGRREPPVCFKRRIGFRLSAGALVVRVASFLFLLLVLVSLDLHACC